MPRPRQRKPTPDLLDDAAAAAPLDDAPAMAPVLPLSEESTHALLLARRRAAAELDARLRMLRRAWRLDG